MNLMSYVQMLRTAIQECPTNTVGLEGLARAEYCCFEEFVLEHGQPFTLIEPPKGLRRGRMGECFSNTWEYVGAKKGTTYVEGIGAMDGLTFVHAWAVDRSGRVIDPTWKYHPKIEYFGIPFEWRFVNRSMSDSQQFGLLYAFESRILKGDWRYVRAKGFGRRGITSEQTDRLVTA